MRFDSAVVRCWRYFSSIRTYKCGGPATACLRAWERLAYTRGQRNDVAVFFRKAAA